MLCRLPTPTQTPSLSVLLDDIGNPPDSAIAKAFAVSPGNVAEWRSNDHAPRAVLLALFWITRWGQSAVDCEARNIAELRSAEASAWKREAERIRHELARVLALGNFGSANDPSTLTAPAVQIRAVS